MEQYEVSSSGNYTSKGEAVLAREGLVIWIVLCLLGYSSNSEEYCHDTRGSLLSCTHPQDGRPVIEDDVRRQQSYQE